MNKNALWTVMALAPVAGQAAARTEKAAQAPRPNIILILADDMGYSDLGCYGGEIETPNLDRLASEGLRYRQFYNGARSCPTRASLLTGLYAHQAGIGWMTAADMGRAPYQGYLNRECVTLAEVLQQADYGTYMTGKWHVASERQNKAKMREYWPNQRGFEQYFGIVEGASNYFHTTLNRNNDQYVQKDSPDFYLTYALSDTAATFIRRHDYAQKPLFLYMAYNAPHWPLQALPEDIARYKERYMRGWDVLRKERFERQKQLGLFPKDAVLSDRDSQVPAWDSLTPEKQEEFASRMAIYAAQVDEMDRGIGRIVKALEDRGQLDNTIIMFLSDNGACAEFISSGERKALDGKGDTYESYRRNWANLSSTPYKEYKHHTNEGGIASPMIVHYPNGISSKLNGNWCDEYGHITDIMPTFVALSGAQYPSEYKGHTIKPMEGVSLLPNLQGRKTGRGETFWEHEGNIGVRDGRWKIVTKVVEDEPFDDSKIMLYNMKKDPTELHDLAAQRPELKDRLYADWTRWAERVGALPIDTRGYGRRQQDYRRDKMNGSFNELLGDWNLSSNGPAEVTFEVDTVHVISAPYTCHINVKKTGERPANGFLKWGFRGHKGETVTASFSIRSSEATNIKFRLEDQDHVNIKPIDESVDLTGQGVQHFTFTSKPLQRDGGFQLVFYVGSAHGDIWVDDIDMKYNAAPGAAAALKVPENLDLYVFIGQSNMAGRGKLSEAYLDTLQQVYILNADGAMEKAVNPLNRYSNIRKELKMQGVGPAYAFCKEMTEDGHPIGVVVNARGGSSIEEWMPGARQDYYSKALERIRQAQQYGTVKGILWHQGEADLSRQDTYMEQLKTLVARLRADLGLGDDVPFVAGEVAQWYKKDQGGASFNKLIGGIGKEIPCSACVSTKGLTPLRNETDPHFDARSQVTLGSRYAAAVRKLNRKNKYHYINY